MCTMGWAESPPAFCAMSETVADLANANSYKNNVPPHRLEPHCEPKDEWNQPPLASAALPTDTPTDAPLASATPRPPSTDPTASPASPWTTLEARSTGLRQTPATARPPPLATILEGIEPAFSTRDPSPPTQPGPLQAPSLPPPAPKVSNRPRSEALRDIDVFVDDFIGIAQGSRRQIRNLRRTILHAIDDVFDKPLPGESRNEAASVKKLLQGDGSWATRKLILGWILDTVLGTIELPEHRKDRLREIFASLRGATRISVKNWQKVIGKLRFMGIGIQGSAGLFGALQLGLRHSDKNQVRITKHIRAHLDDFERLAQDLCSRPTRLAEFIDEDPTVLQAVDAAKPGFGGVLFADGHPPIFWSEDFPQHIQDRVVSADNPGGDITNSDLEQAALLGGADIAAQVYDLREITIASLTDNTPALSRLHHGTVTADSPGAYLCRAASLHQRHYRYCQETSPIH